MLQTEKVFKKIKPDNVSYDSEGKELSSGWTKTGLENYNKSKKELDTLNTAIENAIMSSNYEPLSKLVK